MSPRKRLITKPFTRACSDSESSAKVPYKWANTPPRSISATMITGTSAFSAKPILAMSFSRKLISAGLPAPSIMMASYSCCRRWKESITVSIATFL
ncbi:Uncharacterised protein [Vibrio cholerae]|nr:Uncharacterised protein [Vibrio cholerae]